MDQRPQFYDPTGETLVGKNRLPHWDQRKATYFITFRLADSVPTELLKNHSENEVAWRMAHPEPWDESTTKDYHRLFSGQLERWLDQGMGGCMLRDPAAAEIVKGALLYHDGIRHRLHAWVVMPNHVHTVVETLEEVRLPDLLQSWKGFSARRLNTMMGHSGSVWQRSYFDRVLRGWEHFGNCVRYIRRNPEKAGLKEGEYLRGESALAERF
ncbi:MAG: transposase [Luteolibacter sp.]